MVSGKARNKLKPWYRWRWSSEGDLHGIESRMSENIMKGSYGEMRIDYPDTDEYYSWMGL